MNHKFKGFCLLQRSERGDRHRLKQRVEINQKSRRIFKGKALVVSSGKEKHHAAAMSTKSKGVAKSKRKKGPGGKKRKESSSDEETPFRFGQTCK